MKMSKNNHTPGPWILNPDFTISQKEDKGILIAMVCSANNDDEQREANAKLIASSPQLLEALETLIAVVESLTEEGQLVGGLFKARELVKSIKK